MVVEDDDISREMLSRRLANAGYLVITATNGLEAIKAAQAEAPDLILMDVCMPGLDGVEAAKRLKSDGVTAGIPIIVLTALSSASDVKRAAVAGCDGYETKPVVLPRLLVKIRKAIKPVTSSSV